MYIISITNAIEQAISNSYWRNATGNIKNLDKLFTPQNLLALDNSFDGFYAFIVFHPKINTNVLKYIEEGGLEADTGNSIMALFSTEVQVYGTQTFDTSLFNGWIEIQEQEFIVYEIVKSFFPRDSPKIQFPGIMFIDRLSTMSNIIYVSLPKIKELDELEQSFNKIFRLAEKNFQIYGVMDFADKFSLDLALEKFDYFKKTKVNPEEIVVKFFYKIMKYKGDIISVLGKLL